MERLKTRAMNQKAFGRTLDGNGLNLGGGGVEGIATFGAMEGSC